MKLIDRMERELEGKIVKKKTMDKRSSHIGRADTLRYAKFNFAVRAAFNKKILETEQKMERETTKRVIGKLKGGDPFGQKAADSVELRKFRANAKKLISAGSKVERDKLTMFDIPEEEPVAMNKWQIAVRDKLKKITLTYHLKNSIQDYLLNPESGF
jgi:hypothetical protein